MSVTGQMSLFPGMSRRRLILSATGLALTSACGASACGPVQAPVVRHRDVMAAGQPAALLIQVLAPDRLIGWPRRPSSASLDFLPEPAARLPEVGALTSGGRPASLESVAALNPGLVVDYGDIDPDYQRLAERVRSRLSVDYHLIDGGLEQMGQALRQGGELLGVADRGRRLADRAEAILTRWRRPAGAGPSFYYARGTGGLETAFGESLAVQALIGAGWTNVALAGREPDRSLGQVSREQVVAWDPDIIVTLDKGFAEAAAEDPVWRKRRNGTRRRLVVLPEVPFGWIDRPPSVNRLLGCAWLGGAEEAEMIELISLMFGPIPSPAQAKALKPQWIA